MNSTAVLDVIEDLLNAAQHPDIAAVAGYDGVLPGLAITYRSGAQAYLWPTPGKQATSPAEILSDLPAYKFRAQHALNLVVDLLDTAAPAQFTAWRTVGVDGLGLSPCVLEVRTGAASMVLRVTSGGAPVRTRTRRTGPTTGSRRT